EPAVARHGGSVTRKTGNPNGRSAQRLGGGGKVGWSLGGGRGRRYRTFGTVEGEGNRTGRCRCNPSANGRNGPNKRESGRPVPPGARGGGRASASVLVFRPVGPLGRLAGWGRQHALLQRALELLARLLRP